MSGEVRQWRPSGSVRIAGAVLMIAAIGFAALYAGLGVTGRIPVIAAVPTALLGAWLACIGFGYALRNRIVLGNGVLTLTGVLRTRRIPVEYITRVFRGEYGLEFDLYDGRRTVFRGLEFVVFESWLRDDTQWIEIIDEAQAAAEQARERLSLAPVDATGTSRRVNRRPNSGLVRVVGVLLSAGLLYYSFTSLHMNSGQSQSSSTVAPVAGTVGECMQDPATSFSVKSVPCTSAHTAQVYAVAQTASGGGCGGSLIESKLLPQDHYIESLSTFADGTTITLCLMITPSITHSFVRGH
jgi:hypothetical protein